MNLDRPYHQAIVDNLQVLVATRYDAVVRRLIYPELGHTSFVNLLHESASESSFCDPSYPEDGIMSCVRWRFNLNKTFQTIGREEDSVLDKKTKRNPLGVPVGLTAAGLALEVVDGMDAIFAVERPIGCIQYLVCFGLVGALYKPRVEDVQTVMKQEASKAPMSDTAFRHAVKALMKRALSSREEEILLKSQNRFIRELGVRDYRNAAAAKINRYYQSVLARKILSGLLSPFTTRQHTQDEIDILFNQVEPSYLPEYLPGEPVPVIELPWPILPPGEGSPQQAPRRSPGIGSGKKRQLDRLRITWLEALVARWPYGGGLVPIALHNKIYGKDDPLEMDGTSAEEVPLDNLTRRAMEADESNNQVRTLEEAQARKNYKNRYRAAVLHDEEENPFVIVADTDIAYPEHGLFMGFVKYLRNVHGQPVHWSVVFRGAKGEAQGFGVRRLNHDGPTLYGRVISRILDEYHDQFKSRPCFRKEPEAPRRIRDSGASYLNARLS